MLLSTEVRVCDKVRLSILYLQRFPDDLMKIKIISNDLEGFKVPREVIEKLNLMFGKKKQDPQSLSGLNSLFAVCFYRNSVYESTS